MEIAEATTTTHVRASSELIARAVALAPKGRAAVLGCGRCGEIPVPLLLDSFTHADFVDSDGTALSDLCSRWPATNGHASRSAFFEADLTGLIEPLSATAERIAGTSGEASQCLDHLSRLLAQATPDFWRPAHGEGYSLVICSLVLTQLQATARGSVEAAFLRRFPESRRVLAGHPRWRSAIWSFARRLEEGWMDHLTSLARQGAVVYLADTVHVAWLSESVPESWTTAGAWIATRTSRLADYLRPWEPPLAEERWQWLRREPEGEFAARLYGVQGVIYRTAGAGT